MKQNTLAAPDYRRIIELVSDTLITKSNKALKKLLDFSQELTGFESAISGRLIPGKNHPVDNYVNHSFSLNWLKTYEAENFVTIDPVVRFSTVHQSPFNWNQAFARFPCPGRFLEAAADFNLNNGLAFAVSNNTDVFSIISLSNVPRQNEEIAKFILRILVPTFHEVLAHSDKTTSVILPKLTAKELEVLRWSSEGKSAWEMGCILGITERTIKFHLHNIYRKFDVVNRTQAISKALNYNLL